MRIMDQVMEHCLRTFADPDRHLNTVYILWESSQFPLDKPLLFVFAHYATATDFLPRLLSRTY